MLNSEDLINKVKSYNKFLNPDKLNKAYKATNKHALCVKDFDKLKVLGSESGEGKK